VTGTDGGRVLVPLVEAGEPARLSIAARPGEFDVSPIGHALPMANDQPRSEQQENLELANEPATDEPEVWRAADPDRAEEPGAESPAPQFTPPGGGGAPGDREPTEIAEDAGSAYPAGPEQGATRIEDGER
jgi:hypothetical protein